MSFILAFTTIFRALRTVFKLASPMPKFMLARKNIGLPWRRTNSTYSMPKNKIWRFEQRPFKGQIFLLGDVVCNIQWPQIEVCYNGVAMLYHFDSKLWHFATESSRLDICFININIYDSSSTSVFYTIACSWDFFSASILRQMKSESTHALTLPEINLLSKTSGQPADHSAYIVDKVLQMEL